MYRIPVVDEAIERNYDMAGRSARVYNALRLLWVDVFRPQNLSSEHIGGPMVGFGQPVDKNRSFKMRMITKYSRDHSLPILAIIFTSIFVHREEIVPMVCQLRKDPRKVEMLFPLIVRFHYLKYCNPTHPFDVGSDAGCLCKHIRYGKAKDYRVPGQTPLCGNFHHQIVVDRVGFEYHFVKAIRELTTKYRKKSYYSNKMLISAKNWNKIVEHSGFITDQRLVTALFIRSFIVMETRKVKCGPPGTELKYFPNTGSDHNPCKCEHHSHILPVSMSIHQYPWHTLK